MVFPSRVLKRQLDEAQKRLREMEEELQQIREQEDQERREQKRRRVSFALLEHHRQIMMYACFSTR